MEASRDQKIEVESGVARGIGVSCLFRMGPTEIRAV
jgi:hypothetical protein